MKRDCGQIVTWLDDKGYGFIRSNAGGKEIFLHVKEVAAHQRRPRSGDRVTFEVVGGKTDKPSAARVSISGFSWSFFSVLCFLLLPALGFYGYAVWRQWAHLYPALLVYVVMSLITICAYHRDKTLAQFGGWRISEKTLHLLECLGGWPGGLLAQICFRHKLKKPSFQAIFWLIVIAHGFGWSAVRLTAAGAPSGGASATFSKPPRVLSEIATPSDPYAAPLAGALPKPESDLVASSELSSLSPDPAASETWASDPPSEPPIDDPRARRSATAVRPRHRTCAGVVKAISRSRGILIEMPAEFGGQGVIPPSALVPDFHRRFRAGEHITVAVRGVAMKGARSTFDLLLVEP